MYESLFCWHWFFRVIAGVPVAPETVIVIVGKWRGGDVEPTRVSLRRQSIGFDADQIGAPAWFRVVSATRPLRRPVCGARTERRGRLGGKAATKSQRAFHYPIKLGRCGNKTHKT
ncbi:protein of unknown function (plasmid) [Methylocella tundrae]|uniref:Uncharacterized protein n=1 Tax=Methylocella tundrae TaxID=227605 RepID=A0A4U8Z7Q6_METTU|nr:protein of unknown function [Methylocella tundrae]